MARKPAPTKANLFASQRQLRFASEGRDLLQQKRDVLVMELMGVVSGFADAEKALGVALGQAIDDFLPACVDMGRDGLERAGSGRQPEVELVMAQRSVMGISLPHVSVNVHADLSPVGVLGSTSAFDRALRDLRKVLDGIGEYVETVATIWKLTIEVEKTQKRINALENIFIPESEESIRWIKSVMEENDREDLFRRKLLKGRSA